MICTGPILRSRVPSHEGPCIPTWLNQNTVCQRLDGGTTGFFQLVERSRFGVVKIGDEFHGIIRGRAIYSTFAEHLDRIAQTVGPCGNGEKEKQ